MFHCQYVPQLIYLVPSEGCLGFFQALPVINKAALMSSAGFLVDVHFQVLWANPKVLHWLEYLVSNFSGLCLCPAISRKTSIYSSTYDSFNHHFLNSCHV
jgi:hypothetical protein